MNRYVPDWWTAVLLAGAAFRVWRLLAADTIVEPLRERLVRRQLHQRGGHRRELDIFLHCPWCLGWWVTVAWWGAWVLWDDWVTVAAVPFALNAAVALVAVNLDKGD